MIVARIFLSHSSRNNPEAVALRDWLVREGWDDVFLDLHPSAGIAPGERWELALYNAANRCEAVLLLVSGAWLASSWCLREYHLAQKLNKRVFGILIEDVPLAGLPTELTDHWQLVNLARGADHQVFHPRLPDGSEGGVTFSRSGLQALRTGLTRAGLDPRFFAWPPAGDPGRSPYRGMRPLEAEDAGIFFGREAPVIEVLDRLRGLTEAPPPRFLVILGASGAGKSSFLRAGLLPRLARDDDRYLTLPVIRAERAALNGETGLVRALEEATKVSPRPRSRADIRGAVDAGAGAIFDILEGLLPDEARRSSAKDRGRQRRVIMAIDQGEELFLAEGAREADSFLRLLRDLASAPDSRLIVLITIRSDAYERLQAVPILEGVRQETFSLPPMPRGAYQTVIEGPASRLRDTDRTLKIEPSLTATLLEDAETGSGRDGLPLLAFTLERLYLEYGGDGDLRLSEYRQIGGIKGSIDAAVEGALRAADADPSVPRDRAARETLLRRALIPWLAGVDPETAAPRRRVARLSEIPEEARPLLKHLIEARLLSTDRSPESGETTIEPAHEALLRQWGLLQGWLEEDFAVLSTLEGIRRASRDWSANARADGWLAHAAGRLDDAEDLLARNDFARSLDTTDRAYLVACRAADNTRRNREVEEARRLAEAQKEAADAATLAAERQAEVARRTRFGLVGVALLAAIAAGLAMYGFNQAGRADSEAEAAKALAKVAAEKETEAHEQAILAQQEKEEAQKQATIAEAKTREAIRNESVGLAGLARKAIDDGDPIGAMKLVLAAWPRAGDDVRPRTKAAVDALAKLLPEMNQRLILDGHSGAVNLATFSPSGSEILTASEGSVAKIWDAKTGALVKALEGHTASILSADYSPDGTLVATVSKDRTARIWRVSTGTEIMVLKGHDDAIWDIKFSPDGKSIITAASDGTAKLWSAETGVELATFKIGSASGLDQVTAFFSPDGKRVLASDSAGQSSVWDIASRTKVDLFKGPPDQTLWPSISPDGKLVATLSQSRGTVTVWDAFSGEKISAVNLDPQTPGNFNSVSFSPDSTKIVITDSVWNIVTTWDARAGTKLIAFRGHTDTVVGAAFSPDGYFVVSVQKGGVAKIWAAASGSLIATLAGHTNSITRARFSKDGRSLVTASSDGTARVWAGWAARALSEVTMPTEESLEAGQFLDDGRRLLVHDQDWAGLWNILSQSWEIELPLRDRGLSLRAIQAAGDRILAVIAGSKGTAVIDLKSAKANLLEGGEAATALRTSFSRDLSRIISVTDNQVVVWDARTGRRVATVSNQFREAHLSPDGKRFVAVTLDGGASIWNVSDAKQTAAFRPRFKSFVTAEFSPDGGKILTVFQGGGVDLWDSSSGANLLKLQDSGLYDPSFSASGRLIVTTPVTDVDAYLEDQLYVVWDAETGAKLRSIATRTIPMSTPGSALSSDGAVLLTFPATKLSQATLWDLSDLEPGDIFHMACARLGNDTDLLKVENMYGLAQLKPICGEHSPSPLDTTKLQ